MAHISKRYKAIKTKVDRSKSYALADAMRIVKENATAKFNESIDVAINLGIDAKKSDQLVRGAIVLPQGTGKTKRVAVFTQGENANKARAAGADVVGLEDLAEQVKSGKIDFIGVDAIPEIDRWLADHRQLDPGISAREPRHDLRQVAVGVVVRHAKTNAPGKLRVGERCHRFHVELDDAPRVVEQPLAIFGQLRGAAVARELAIAGAGVLKLGDAVAAGESITFGMLLTAALTFFVALGTITVLMKLIRHMSFLPFAIYRVALGVMLTLVFIGSFILARNGQAGSSKSS